MSPLALVIALPAALAGAWYLVNPNAATRLTGIEGERANRSRVRLRRVNGVVMILAGIVLYFAVSRTIWLTEEDNRRPGLLLPLAWMATVPLVIAMLSLAYLDMRLTRRMRRKAIEDAIRSGGKKLGAIVALCTLLAAAGCDGGVENEPETRPATPSATRPAETPEPDGPRPQSLPTLEMTLGEEPLTLQVANDEEERRVGLMYRRELGANEGMLFIFPERDWLSFWMRNTFVPLDLVFIDERGRVLNVEPGTPHSERSLESAGPAKYVIEIAQGRAGELGLKRGTQLEMPDIEAED